MGRWSYQVCSLVGKSESRPPSTSCCCLHPPSTSASPLLIPTSYTPQEQQPFIKLFGLKSLTYVIMWPLLDERLELETFKECPNLGQCLFLLEVTEDRR